MIYIKASFLVGVLSPARTSSTRSGRSSRPAVPAREEVRPRLLPFSLVLFLAGAAMAFFFVFEPVLNFLFSFNRSLGIDLDPRISEWLSFVLILPLGFGISFQLPLVMLFLERIGIFTVVDSTCAVAHGGPGDLRDRGDADARATPTACAMAVPLTLLYFGGIRLCKYLPRRPRMDETADEQAVSD